MKQIHTTIRFVPSIRKGNGTGHLRRCLEMAGAINDSAQEGGAVSACVLLEDRENSLSTVNAMLEAFPDVPAIRGRLEAADITVIDSRENTIARVESMKKHTTVVGYDEDGPGRGYCDYLVDTFPVPGRRSAPNAIAAPAHSPHRKRTEAPAEFRSIVLTFGGEDPAGLTPLVCRALVSRLGVRPEGLTAVRGPSAKKFDLPRGVTLLEKPANLREMFHEYDLVITSFGLTAYEALAAGVPVLLVNPTRYHKQLSKLEGFAHAGVRRVRAGKLRRVLQDPAAFVRRTENLRAGFEGTRWLDDTGGLTGAAGVIAELTARTPALCPVCGCPPGKAVARFAGRTYFRCFSTGVVWLSVFDRKRTSYDTSYFFSEYKAQYGKTYLEDFDNIKDLAGPRLQAIRTLIPQGAVSLLDVGCAYGPFLAAAAEAGFHCHGIDISPPAVAYVREVLGMEAAVTDFLTYESKQFDCLSMWYVIEHFEDLRAALTKAAALVRPGGVFAFSTPNLSGITGRRSLKRFLESSPRDHFTVWSPRAAKNILKKHGFIVKKIRVTGHHPERFPFLSQKRSGVAYRAVMTISRIFRLGDTFEVYAVRGGENSHAG